MLQSVLTNVYNHYSLKICPRFWFVKTTRIVHHNQLLLTKFETNLCHVQPMTSKVQPAADYWTVDRENLVTRLCFIWWAEKARAKWRNSFKNGEIFWMKTKAIIEFGCRRIWRILQISEGVIHLSIRTSWITPCLICRILHILFSLIQQWLLNLNACLLSSFCLKSKKLKAKWII